MRLKSKILRRLLKTPQSSGVDVFKALALGADAVIIARPFVTAVYGGAQEGVEAYVNKIGSELKDTMAMCGVASLKEITRDCVRV